MNAGYKGIVYNHPGYVSAPNIPNIPISWQDRLKELELKFASWLKIGNVSREAGIEDVNWMMTTSYPGNYHVVEVEELHFALKFDSPEDATAFRLRWG